MAQQVFRLSETGAALGFNPALLVDDATGDVLLAARNSAGNIAVVRAEDDGTIVWQVALTVSGESNSDPTTALGVSGLAIAGFNPTSGTSSFVALLDPSDGTILWNVNLPTVGIYGGGFGPNPAIDSNGDVFVTGAHTSSGATNYLLKLDGTDGTVLWQKNCVESTLSSSGYQPQGLVLLSTDDPVLVTVGTAAVPAIWCFDGATGALNWARTFSLAVTTGGGTGAFDVQLAVDPSDNIYAIPSRSSSKTVMDVLKLTSSGTPVWDVTVAPATDLIIRSNTAKADASGVFFGWEQTDDSAYSNAAIGFLTADGSTAVSGAAYPMPDEPYGFASRGFAMVAGVPYLATINPYAAYAETAVIVVKDEMPLVNASFAGGFAFVGQALTIGSSSASTSSYSPTVAADPTVTPGAGGVTSGASALTVQVYAEGGPSNFTGYATGFKPTLFGSARNGYSFPASGFLATHFGTPALDYNLEAQAHGFLATKFGVPYAIDHGPPAPRSFLATGLFSTTFGSPAAAASGLYAQQATTPSTAFGTPKVRLSQPASSIAPGTTFGTHGAVVRARGIGFKATAFGTPTATVIAQAQGFSSTAVGTPRAPGTVLGSTFTAAGFNPTRFGTPRVRMVQATTSIAPTTTFGQASATLAQGFKATVFGTPTSVRAAVASGWLTTRYGTPTAPGAVLGAGGLASGFLATKMGAPRVVLRQQASGIAPTTTFGAAGITVASGFLATKFGTPRAALLGYPAGFLATKFGTPRAPGAQFGRYFDVEGFLATKMGTPTARLRQQASSIAPTALFGTPGATTAKGFLATQFGMPSAVIVTQARGFLATKMGTPTAPGAVLGAGGLASGFLATKMGSPTARLRQQVGSFTPTTIFGTPGITVASGWKATKFGTPTATMLGYPVGFLTTRFGTPRAPGAQYGRYFDVEGFLAAKFGLPAARLRQQASSIAPGTTFGTPGATTARGFKATQFGMPSAVIVAHAQGFLAGGMGTPRAPGAQFGRYFDAYSLDAVARFGTPRSVKRQQATTIGVVTQFGTPFEASLSQATGWKATLFGTPQANFITYPQGFLCARFGVPKSPTAAPNGGLADGFSDTMFGTPRASAKIVGLAQGIHSTALGTPAVLQGHRAASLGRVTRFGNPDVARTCPP